MNKIEDLFEQCENNTMFMLSCKEIKMLINDFIPNSYIKSFDEIHEFVNGCIKLRASIRIACSKGITHIIAPGDSPTKIVKWLNMVNPYIQVQFICFPLSNLSKFECCSENIDNYI